MPTPQRRHAAAALAVPLLAVALASCSTTPAAELAVGDCLDAATLRDSGGMVGRVSVLDCGDEHDTEVVGVHDVVADDYPGPEELNAIAGEECTAAFRDYVGVAYADSDLELVPLIPSETGWGADDHRIVCLATAPEPVTESFEGSGR